MHKDKKKKEEGMGEGEWSHVSNYNLNITNEFLDSNFISNIDKLNLLMWLRREYLHNFF